MALHKQVVYCSQQMQLLLVKGVKAPILICWVLRKKEAKLTAASFWSSCQFGTSYRHVQRVIKQFIDQGITLKEAFKTYRGLQRQTLENWLYHI